MNVKWFDYNANGGANAPAVQTVAADTIFKLSDAIPTRNGYTFLGWSTSSSATTAPYNPGQSLSLRANLTLYAVWQISTNTVYTITYNANGGTDAPGSQRKTDGVPLTLSSTRPTRTDYTFQGWATSADAIIVQYQPGGTYSENANTTLYAIWQQNSSTTYAVAVANGSGGGSFTAGTTVTITANAAPSGQRFKEWSITPAVTFVNGTGKTSSTAQFAMPAGAVTATAVYENGSTELPVTYTVTYNANGGSGAPGNQTKTQGAAVTLSSITPTRTSHTFKGWATTSDATIALYQPGGQYTVDANVTLYAVWEAETITPPNPIKTIFSTKYEATLWNWILFIVGFGWAWMWFV